MGRNASRRRAYRELAADDRFMSGPAPTATLDPILECVICGRAWDRSCGEVVYSPAGSRPISYRRRRYCAEHIGVYLLTRLLRKRGASKRDAAAGVLRIVAGQKAAQAAQEAT